MSVELIKDLLKLEQIVGEGSAQIIVEGDILVPDTKPDISSVLSARATARITKQEIFDNKIAVEGITNFKILYASDKGDMPLYSIDSSTTFKQTIDVEGITPKMKGEVTLEVEHVDFSINNDRKIGVKAVIDFNGNGVEEKTIALGRDVAGDAEIQVLKQTFKYTDIVGVERVESLAKETFEIDEDEAEIMEVLKWDAVVVERETKITDGKVIVGGNVSVEILYIVDEEENPLRVMRKEIPFTQFIEFSHVYSDMSYKLKLSADELYTNIKENIRGERKIVDVEVIVKVEVQVIDTASQEFLVDTYSLNKVLEIHREKIQMNENICTNKTNVFVKEVVDIPHKSPAIDDVFSVDVKPILTDYNLLPDKVVIEGVLELEIIYRSAEGVHSFNSFTQEIPFRHYVNIEGVNEDMQAKAQLHIEEIKYNVINGGQVDVKVNVGASLDVYRKKFVEIITNIEELNQVVDNSTRPSLTIYFIQPEDTLWKIAKKYNTTVDRILETNSLEAAGDVKAGEHIIIEKVHIFKL